MLDERLVGAWDLVDAVAVDRSGGRSTDPFAGRSGQIVYTSEGRMAVLIANGDGSSGGYWGHWDVRPAEAEILHDVGGATEARLLGTTQVRSFVLAGDTLTLGTPADADGNRRELVWRRVSLG